MNINEYITAHVSCIFLAFYLLKKKYKAKSVLLSILISQYVLNLKTSSQIHSNNIVRAGLISQVGKHRKSLVSRPLTLCLPVYLFSFFLSLFSVRVTLCARHVNPREKATRRLAGWWWKTPDSIYWAVNVSLTAAGFRGLSSVTGHLIRRSHALPERKRAFRYPNPNSNSSLPSGGRTALPGCHFGFCQTCKASLRADNRALGLPIDFLFIPSSPAFFHVLSAYG